MTKVKIIKYISVTMIGAIIGFLYYYFIGCKLGSCPIKSSPVSMTAIGGALGFLLGVIFWSD